MNPYISIIVPIYNVEKYLKRCMDSLLRQTLSDIEIIMVDDGSPDNCPKICDDYLKKDKRVKVIHKENAGLGFARNSGLEIASGEYVAFVDPDDYVMVDMYEKLYRNAKKYNADVVHGSICYVDGEKKRFDKSVGQVTVWNGEAEIRKLILDVVATEPKKLKDTIMEVSVWKAIFCRKLLEDYQIRFVSERQFISEDIIFDIDYFLHCRCIVAIPDPVYFYCANPNSLSKSFRLDRFQKVIILYQEIKRKLYESYDKETVDYRLRRFLIAGARINSRQIMKYRKEIGGKSADVAIKNIVEHPEVRNAVGNYPISELPKKYALIAFLMKYKFYRFLKFVLRIRNCCRN